MYSKEVTTLIMQDWAKGASAEETRNHIEEVLGVKPALNTIYTHRHSLTTQDLIDELLRQQERDITKTDDKTALHYRNELLKILLPIKILQLNKNLNINKEVTEVKISVQDMLTQYEDLFEEATILENCAPEPIHSPQANNKTGSVSPMR